MSHGSHRSSKIRAFSAGIALLLVIMATPKRASAYVDPGSGAMLWQIAAAAMIGALFYVRRVVTWLREHLGLRSPMAMGFLFATVYALIASPLVCSLFHARPLPRFNDIFLVGIVLTTYLFTWEAAAYLLVIALAVSAWVLPPYDSFAVTGLEDWYRMVSFACISVFLIGLVHRLKGRRADQTHPQAVASIVSAD